MNVEFVVDGDWIDPTPQQNHTLICCDCGLVHSMDFRVEDGRAQFRAFRDEAQSSKWRAEHPDLPMQSAPRSGGIHEATGNAETLGSVPDAGAARYSGSATVDVGGPVRGPALDLDEIERDVQEGVYLQPETGEPEAAEAVIIRLCAELRRLRRRRPGAPAPTDPVLDPALQEVFEKLAAQQRDLDPAAAKILRDHLWTLYDSGAPAPGAS